MHQAGGDYFSVIDGLIRTPSARHCAFPWSRA
jgi:hypothetical protein